MNILNYVNKSASVWLPQELYKQSMRKAASEECYSFSELVRNLLIEYLEEQ